jgi:hypothetical protein
MFVRYKSPRPRERERTHTQNTTLCVCVCVLGYYVHRARTNKNVIWAGELVLCMWILNFEISLFAFCPRVHHSAVCIYLILIQLPFSMLRCVFNWEMLPPVREIRSCLISANCTTGYWCELVFAIFIPWIDGGWDEVRLDDRFDWIKVKFPFMFIGQVQWIIHQCRIYLKSKCTKKLDKIK